MDLFDNPFHLLGATTRDDRRRLMDLAEEKSLHEDAEACRQAMPRTKRDSDSTRTTQKPLKTILAKPVSQLQ